MNDLERIINLAGVKYEAPVKEETATTERELKEGIASLQCKHCGDMLGQPTTDCGYDSMDPKGDNWVMVDIDGDGDPDIAIQQESSCGCCNEDPCGCDDDCECKMNEASCGSKKKHKHEGIETEEVGELSDPIYDLIDELGNDDKAHTNVLHDLIRYLDGDTIADFVKEFRSNHEYDNGMEYESAGEVESEIDEAPNEGNEFSGNRKAAIDAGEDEFKVDGKKYKVKESEEVEEEQLDELIQGVDSETGKVITGPNKGKIAKSHLTKNPYDDEALRSLKKEDYNKDEYDEEVVEELEEISEAPTMDTTQLIHLLKLSGISEDKINEHIEKLSEQWANTPDGVGEKEPTVHGDDDNYNFAQAVNLSLKRYLDAQDMKVSVNEGHTTEGMKAKYDAIKNK